MILDRRSFIHGMPALMAAGAAAAAPVEKRTRFYVLEQFFLENGTQPGRIHEFFSKTLLPKMEKVHKGPKIVLEAMVAPHQPQVALIMGVETLDEIYAVSRALFADEEFSKSFDRWEAGETAYVSASASLLEATDYSPEIVPMEKPPAQPRIFELRVYHSPTARQWKLLHERFAGPEIKIFHRVGVHPVFYTSTVFGTMRPNLTYLIPFESLAAREKAWSAFAADPEWVKVRRESIEKGGQISLTSQISLWRATPYSPVR